MSKDAKSIQIIIVIIFWFDFLLSNCNKLAHAMYLLVLFCPIVATIENDLQRALDAFDQRHHSSGQKEYRI